MDPTSAGLVGLAELVGLTELVWQDPEEAGHEAWALFSFRPIQ